MGMGMDMDMDMDPLDAIEGRKGAMGPRTQKRKEMK